MRYLFILKLFFIITCFFFSSIAIGADNDPTQINTPVIQQYQSNITVEKDSTLSVTETITVTTDGRTIQHGIFRDFPTTYQTPQGTVHVSFDVQDTTLDGQSIPFHTENISNGVHVYIGDSHKYLSAGTYVFSLTYTTSSQVGFFQDHDELYWNVTGNGWKYPIESALATVSVSGATANDITGSTAYTGNFGSREQNYTSRVNNAGEVLFQTTQPLAPEQGLTVVVGWKKGIITPPSGLAALGINNNKLTMYLAMLAGIFIVLFYYLIMWFKHGRSSHVTTIVPQYYPPEGYTPAALRYILDMGYDNKVLTAAILNLAVKGYLKITENKEFFRKSYVLTKCNASTTKLSASEQVIADTLFANGDSVALDKPGLLKPVVESYKDSLKKEFSQLFVTNIKYVKRGAFLSILIALAFLFKWPAFQNSIIISSVFFTAIAVIILRSVSTKPKLWSILVILIIFFVFFRSDFWNNAPCLIFIAILFVINLIFMRLLKYKTADGNKIALAGKGFKMFLAATEKDRLNFRNPPDRTPELFEKYLPYALALGVEQKWCEHFADQLVKLNYQPTWYVGAGNFLPQGFASNLSGSLQDAISSAATPPGSSSGFGGGSSGGGGGGGGGGW